jgi:hypothetical protein
MTGMLLTKVHLSLQIFGTRFDNLSVRFMPALIIHRFMMHDPRTYKDPHVFNPSRFLGDNPEPDPRTWVFGFGRRICPGEISKPLTNSNMLIKEY